MVLVLEKARSRRAPNLGRRGTESLGWFDVLPKNSARDVMHDQLPIAVAFCIIRIVLAEECSSLMQNWMEICCSTCSVILNRTATQYTCSLNGIYCPHWLVQWSCYCLSMGIPVHSFWLPGYTDVVQTLLLILTMAGLFLYRPVYVNFMKPPDFFQKLYHFTLPPTMNIPVTPYLCWPFMLLVF